MADWVWRQRDQYRLYRLGQPSTLTTTRIAKLTELGFEFIVHDHNGNPVYHDNSKQNAAVTPEKTRQRRGRNSITKQNTIKPTPKSRFKEGKWLESLAKVVAYKEEHGNCNVPRKWKKDPTLGEWVHFQRRQFRLKQLNRRNHMTDERIRKLEAIGFEWSRGTPNPSSYGMRAYSDQKEQYEEQKIEENSTAVVMPTTEHMMELTPMAMMNCKEQAQQIGEVVEQHVTTEHHGTAEHHDITEHYAPAQHYETVQHHATTEQHVQLDHNMEAARMDHIETGVMETLAVGDNANSTEAENQEDMILSV